MPEATEPGQLEVVETLDGSAAIAAFNRSEIDVQISTAKRYPRSIKRVLENARTLATLDEDTAGTMWYALPRAGKTIEGPSIRFAEIVGSSWGNLRYGGRVVAIDDRHVTAQGAAFDLENNLAATVEVKRRITDNKGRRYNDDMITTASQAAISIALRNAIFRVVPFALVKGIYEEARRVSAGTGRTIQQRRTMALEVYAKWGAKPEDVCLIAGVKGVDELDDEALVLLRGLVNSIRENETTYDQVIRNAREATTTVEVEALGKGTSAADVVAGAATGQDLAEDKKPEPPAPPKVEPIRPTVAAPVPAEADSIRQRLAEIDREAAERSVKPAILEMLYRKHLGSTAVAEFPQTTDTWVKLGKILQEIRSIQAKK